jgi:hypothetical protein
VDAGGLGPSLTEPDCGPATGVAATARRGSNPLAPITETAANRRVSAANGTVDGTARPQSRIHNTIRLARLTASFRRRGRPPRGGWAPTSRRSLSGRHAPQHQSGSHAELPYSDLTLRNLGLQPSRAWRRHAQVWIGGQTARRAARGPAKTHGGSFHPRAAEPFGLFGSAAFQCPSLVFGAQMRRLAWRRPGEEARPARPPPGGECLWR